MNIGEVLRCCGRTSPSQHLQAPLPRGRGPRRAGPDPVGLPEVLRRRRRAAALRPDRAARPLPAAEGHQGAPRRDRPRAGAAAAPATGPQVPRLVLAGDGFPSADSLRRRALRAAAARARAARRRRDRRRACSTQLETFGLVVPAAGLRPLRQRRDRDRQDGAGAGRVRHRAAAPAGLQDRRRPRGRPGRAGRLADPAQPRGRCRGPGRGGHHADRRRSRCGCTRRWSRPGCAASADPRRGPVGLRPRE